MGGNLRGGANIKSVQETQISLYSSSENITIAEVDVSKSIIIASFRNLDGSSTGVGDMSVLAKFTNSTTVTVEKAYGGSGISCRLQIIEFTGSVKVQSGLLTGNSHATEATISDSIASVDLSKAYIVFTTKYASMSNPKDHYLVESGFSSNTGVVFTYRGSGSTETRTIQYYVVEG